MERNSMVDVRGAGGTEHKLNVRRRTEAFSPWRWVLLLLVVAGNCFAGGQDEVTPATVTKTTHQAQESRTGQQPEQTQGGGERQTGNSTQPDKKAAAGKEKKTAVKAIAGFDLQASRDDILSHLNAVISLYRSSITPIQKAGEPNDVVYFEQSVELSSQAAAYAFQSAQAEAALAVGGEDSSSGDRQKLQNTKANVGQELVALKARAEALDKQIATANSRQVAGLRTQRKDVQAAIDLNNSMEDALEKIVGISGATGGNGLAADVERLQRSVPELNSKTKIVSPQLTTLESARSSGVSSQGMVLFQLLETKHDLDGLIAQNDVAHQKAMAVKTPISSILRTIIGKGQALSRQAVDEAAPVAAPATATKTKKPAKTTISPAAAAPVAAAAAPPEQTPTETLDSITADFKALSSAAIPLSQEIIVLEEGRANLTAWQGAIEQEYKGILHALLLRVAVIAIALGIIFAAGEVWRRATNKYIKDSRRRRQLLVVRRIAIGFLSIIVVLFGFVTQFNSLATFAGFITAGIAVGLQTILLSVAAYFFIVGRYGVKVGDRITVSSVTGDVIDVGLVRFYVMELAGSGVELNPTGRVAVFSNAVLFQAGTPLYKQIPGTEFAWHELIVKLSPTTDYTKVCEAIMKEVHAVYESYRVGIERQHRDVESWMQSPIPAPAVDSRLQFSGGGLQLWARFPVEIGTAAQIDEDLTKRVLRVMDQSDEFKQAFAGTPVIQASVKG